jgi:hypothetical protein
MRARGLIAALAATATVVGALNLARRDEVNDQVCLTWGLLPAGNGTQQIAFPGHPDLDDVTAVPAFDTSDMATPCDFVMHYGPVVLYQDCVVVTEDGDRYEVTDAVIQPPIDSSVRALLPPCVRRLPRT